MCGKNNNRSESKPSVLGSPPRVREKRTGGRPSQDHIRITPACAGKTPLYRQSALPSIGSPPRVREKLIVEYQPSVWTRITPACAGKTLQLTLSQGITQDHPRVCGKNELSEGTVLNMVGSPPRVREKPRCNR